jgi:nucleotide-binding universal stress UspA family protein
MTTIMRILCPIDFSEFSRHAADHAFAVARWYGATVTGLHVTPLVPASLPPAGDGLSPSFVFSADDRRRLTADLGAFLRESAADLPIEAKVIEGNVAGQIVRVAEDLPADLLVMGTHGRSGFERLLLGSVTEKLLRRAPCPLLTVPRRTPDAVPIPVLFRRILCPVDFSPSSLKALAFAESLAKEADAHLTVMHVLEPASVFEPVVMGGPGGPPPDRDARVAARRRLAEAIAPEARVYSHVGEVVVSGKPYREILREAQELQVDLIVLGAHSLRVGALAFGSTANHVVSGAARPVLTLRA